MSVLRFAGASGREVFAGHAGCFQSMGCVRNCSAAVADLASAPEYAIALFALTMALVYGRCCCLRYSTTVGQKQPTKGGSIGPPLVMPEED